MKKEIEEMNKAVRCLALELPEQVFLDFFGRWTTFRDSLPVSIPADVQERAKEWKTVTDNDLIEAAKLFHSEYEWTIKERTAFHVVVECKDYRIWFWLTDDDFIDFEELYHGEENIQAHGGESEPCSSYRTIIDIIDYFRYRGYNLPNKFAGASSGMQWVKDLGDRISEVLKETEGGIWQPCSGCYETEDGHEVGEYPYNETFKSKQGGGCHECGGLGMVFNDYSNYPEIKDESSLSSMQEENERLRKANSKLLQELGRIKHVTKCEWTRNKTVEIIALNKQQ